MAERHLIVDHLKFSYDGLFNLAEFYTIISEWFLDKGWDFYEKLNQEIVTPTGKQIRLKWEPWKSVSDYYTLGMAIKINLIDVKEVEVEVKNKPLKLNQGMIRITFDGYVVSDRKDKWKEKPFFWFLSLIFDKYFFKSHFARMETWLKSDLDDLHNKIKTYLNVFKYTYHT